MMKWERKFNIRAPLEQAERCLVQWLKEERRALPVAERRRAAGLMARYFYHEEDVTDQLMLSFLRHYSNGNVLDMEDPASVRMEIKSVLDQSQTCASASGRWRMTLLFIVFIMSLAGLIGLDIAGSPINDSEQADLKTLVHEVVAHDPRLSSMKVWDMIKRPLHIRRYADMDRWEYLQSRLMLEKLLQRK